MTRKILWLGSLVAVGLGAALTTKLVTRSPTQSAPSADVTELSQRLARLEKERSESGRAFARNVMQMGAPVMAAGGTEAFEPAAEQAAEAKREEAFAERERKHFDELDRQSRTGSGAAALTQLKSNIQELRNLPPSTRVALDVASLDCGEKLCRLELSGPTRAQPHKFIPALLKGMGSNLSTRPASAGRAVYYVSAAGQEIPPVAP